MASALVSLSLFCTDPYLMPNHMSSLSIFLFNWKVMILTVLLSSSKRKLGFIFQSNLGFMDMLETLFSW